MKLTFNEKNKKLTISSVTACEWSCVVTEGNFTLKKYYGKLPLNNQNYIDVDLITYGTENIFGNITCVFKSNNCLTKKTLSINNVSLHIFSVTNTNITLFGENTKSYVYVYYGIAQQNYENTLGPLKITIGNESYVYNGNYNFINVKENEENLYNIRIQPYNELLGLFEICIDSKCNFPFTDVLILEGVNDKNEKQILYVNIKQGIVEHVPSLLKISPNFIFLSSDNPIQKINVTSINNGVFGDYIISETPPTKISDINLKNDVDAYLNNEYVIEPYINENLIISNLIRQKKPTEFTLDMSSCENDDESGNIAYELYVINKEDNSMYKKLEFFYDYIFDPNNYIQIESVTNAKAYIYIKKSDNDKDIIKSINADTNNKISFINDEFDMQISLTLLFIQKNSYNEQNFLKKEYIDYVIAEYDENKNIIFTINANPNWWKILTQSDYVKEVKNGNNLSISLENIIPNNDELEYVILENRLGKKCTIYLKTEGDVFSNNGYIFGLSKNKNNIKPSTSLKIETKPISFKNETNLISYYEKEIIFTIDKVVKLNNDEISAKTLETIFYIYDSNSNKIDIQIKDYTFDILYDSNIGKKYINYGSISQRKIDNKVEHILKDSNIYYINDENSFLLPIPTKSNYIPWSIINYGTGIKYDVYTKLYHNDKYYYPTNKHTVIKILDNPPSESDFEDDTVYLVSSLKNDIIEDISTIIFQQYGSLNESFLYINRKANQKNINLFINKIGNTPSLHKMKDITIKSLNEIINSKDSIDITINDGEKNAYYTSYKKTDSFTTIDNNDIEFFILKEGKIKYENDSYITDYISGDLKNSKNKLYCYNNNIDDSYDINTIIDIITKNGNVVNEWELSSGILYIPKKDSNNYKINFPEIGVKQLKDDNKNYLYFEENDNEKLHFLFELNQKKTFYFGKNLNIPYSGNSNSINVECLYKVIEKSVLIDKTVYIFDEIGTFIYPEDNIRYYCYEENNEWYVDLNSKKFDIIYDNFSTEPKYYILISNEKIYLNNFECVYNNKIFSPTLKINLKGLSLEVLENSDGDNEKEKEKYIILNNEKYVCNKIINDKLIFDYVDLDLSSGTLWAKTNVGAESEDDDGLYFAWGDTEGTTKYNTTNGNIVLDLEDDAAHVHMGGDWHMPTKEQLEELSANTTYTWTTNNGIKGIKFTSKINQNKYIFIPCGVITNNGETISTNNISIWSNTSSSNTKALYLYGDANGLSINTYERSKKMPVRGVGGINTISLNHNYKLEIIGNKVTFNNDYYLDIINEPSHEYVLINKEKHKLSNGVLVYENNKYVPFIYDNNKYILINNKGYKVYYSEAYYYCIINNVKYTFDEKSLSGDTISFIENVDTVNKNDYYEINEIVNKEFSYYLDFNNLLDNDLITCSYKDKELSLGYVNINNKNYGIQKEFNIDTNTLDVIGNEYISIPLSEILKDINHNFNNFNISFNDETEIINHKTNTSTKYVSGNTLSYDDIDGLLLTINDYSKITFNSNIILQVKNDCKIIYHLENENIELDLLENETLFINSGIILTFSDVTKIKLINNDNIPLYVFDDVAIIDEEAYTSILSNDQKIIRYDNNFYYVFNKKVDILGKNYAVYEKSILYKIISNNKVKTISHEINKFNDNDDKHTVHDYGYIDDNKNARYLSKENYSGITYTLHLPVYEIDKKWIVSGVPLTKISVYKFNTSTTYTRAEFEYPNFNKKIIIENGKFNFKVNVYEISKEKNLKTMIVINNSQTEFSDNNRVYSFWDYYGNTYLKRIYTTDLSESKLNVTKKITLSNVKYKLDINKYVKIDGELCQIVRVQNLDINDIEFTNKLLKYNIAIKQFKYLLKKNNDITEKYLTHILKKETKFTLNGNIFNYSTKYSIFPNYKIMSDYELNDTLNGLTIDNITNDYIAEINHKFVDLPNDFKYFKNLSNYNDAEQFYVIYGNEIFPIVKSIAYVKRNIEIIKTNGDNIYAIFDIDSYLTHNMYITNTYEREGNIRMLKIKNAIDIPHNESIIIKVKNENNDYLYGKYLIDFNVNEE